MPTSPDEPPLPYMSILQLPAEPGLRAVRLLTLFLENHVSTCIMLHTTNMPGINNEAVLASLAGPN